MALVGSLERRRYQASSDLQALLQKRQLKITRRLEVVGKAFHPHEAVAIANSEALSLAKENFSHIQSDSAAKSALARASDKRLHSIRKSAKVVRYLAEAITRSHAATVLARRFQAVQNSGGQWHDWLELAVEAKDYLGRKHPLTKLINTRCKLHRAAFLRSLESVS